MTLVIELSVQQDRTGKNHHLKDVVAQVWPWTAAASETHGQGKHKAVGSCPVEDKLHHLEAAELEQIRS